MNTLTHIPIEIVYAHPEHPLLLKLHVPVGCTVKTALLDAKILEQFPELSLETTPIGIFSQRVGLSHILEAYDRIELYCPLLIDPKTARQRRVEKKKSVNKR